MIRVLVTRDVAFARELRDAGVEVIYVDGRPDALVAVAVQEDVDAVVVPGEYREAVADGLAAAGIGLAVLGETTVDDLVEHVR